MRYPPGSERVPGFPVSPPRKLLAAHLENTDCSGGLAKSEANEPTSLPVAHTTENELLHGQGERGGLGYQRPRCACHRDRMRGK